MQYWGHTKLNDVYCVVGLGKTGRACLAYLLAQGKKVYAVDSRPVPPDWEGIIAQFPDMHLQCGPLRDGVFSEATCLVVSPGLPLTHPAILAAHARGVQVTGDIGLFATVARAPIVAITGTNGKTTVTTWMAAFAKAAGWSVRVGGNIGTPVLELLADTEPDLYVLELSSYQLDTAGPLPLTAAVLLNVTPDHLDRYGTLEAYTHSKQQLYQQCTYALYNRADPLTVPRIRIGQTHSFGLDVPTAAGDVGIAQVAGIDWFFCGVDPLFPVSTLPLQGRHHVANALAVLGLAEGLGIPRHTWKNAVASLHGLPHRCQLVGTVHGIRFINDSKGTNSAACLTAVESFGPEGRLVLLLGGISKEKDFSHLRGPLAQYARAVIVFGQAADQLSEALAGCVPIIRTTVMSDAVKAAVASAQLGDIILLSPACTSLDQYQDYQERGRHFEACVQSYLQGA